MTKEEAKKAAEVMIAYADGKEIECKSKIHTDSWSVYKEISFDWYHFDYRIKQEPKLIPFTFEDAELFLGKPLKAKRFDYKSIIVDCGVDRVSMAQNKYTLAYKYLLEEYMFLDGSPCGKIVSE